ncbi:MAG: adenylate/guanylate cyclase domain-containing protein [Synergistaceae bacterium]|nr:adenylate/guanylate cyclase domain-containing protein [Synergistaceae bacterium]
MVRRALSELYYGGTRYPSLAVEMYALYTGREPDMLRELGELGKLGDAAMAFWGAPYDIPNPTLAAVRAALAMREESVALERKLTLEYGRGVKFGIGINTGDAIIGNIGASFRMDYTAIGDTVNTAARLESNAKPGQILISRAAADSLPDKSVELNFLGGLEVKGKYGKIPVFEVVGG